MARRGDGGLSVRFWGVRGSIPSPGPRTARVGGNTSCVEVRAGDRTVIFDMGTGLRGLGESLLREAQGRPIQAAFFISHYHWDHIQGLPFFGPGFGPKNRFTVHGPAKDGHGVRDVLAGQMVPPYFPVPLEALRAKLTWKTVRSGQTLKFGDATVKVRELHHPGGCYAYRIDRGGASLVYATDFEHGTAADEALVAFAKGATALVIDAQYTPDEYEGRGGPAKVGWGHTTWQEAARFAERAAVETLVLYHHDPTRSDTGVEEFVRLAAPLFSGTTIAAREGELLAL